MSMDDDWQYSPKFLTAEEYGEFVRISEQKDASDVIEYIFSRDGVDMYKRAEMYSQCGLQDESKVMGTVFHKSEKALNGFIEFLRFMMEDSPGDVMMKKRDALDCDDVYLWKSLISDVLDYTNVYPHALYQALYELKFDFVEDFIVYRMDDRGICDLRTYETLREFRRVLMVAGLSGSQRYTILVNARLV